MISLQIQVEAIEYRLILVRAGSDGIWIERCSDGTQLPRLSIPRCSRRSEELQIVIKDRWNLDVVILDLLHSPVRDAACAIAEVISPWPDHHFRAVAIDALDEGELTPEGCAMVSSIFTNTEDGRGAFSSPGWLRDAIALLRTGVDGAEVLPESIRQLNCAGGFVLLRCEMTDGRVFWLKATGEPNIHEFRVTQVLMQCCPEFLPRQVAVRREWNAWWMEDAGAPVTRFTLLQLEHAVSAMAELQMKSLHHTAALRAAGAIDRRLSTLRSGIPGIISYLADAMERQASTKVPRIERQRLINLGTIVEDACLRMEELTIPDTLLHGDTNYGNVLFRGNKCVFIDWSEAGIGNPFLGFHHLCLLSSTDRERWFPRLSAVYAECWHAIFTSEQLKRGYALMSVLAAFCYLYGRGDWLSSPKRNDPLFQSYARSLARHMDRAAREPNFLEALCH
jgi:Phosphotransferase enzyme family